MSKIDYSKKLEEIKKQGPNKTCFDCWEKGTTYVVMDFGTFVCSRCAGILRELNYKVKGTGVTIFNQKDIEFISKIIIIKLSNYFYLLLFFLAIIFFLISFFLLSTSSYNFFL